MPPLTAQPANGIAPSTWRAKRAEAEPGRDRGEHLRQPLLVDLDAVRGGDPQHEPDLVQRQDGEVCAGDEDRDPQDPVPARERLDQLATERLAKRRHVRRQSGSRLAEPGNDGGGDLVDGEARTRAALDDVGREHVRDVEVLRAGLDDDGRHLGPRGGLQLPLVLVRRCACEDADQAGGVLDAAADTDRAGRRTARELLGELLRERAAHQQRPRLLRCGLQLPHEAPDRHRVQKLRHQRALLRPRWPRT